jgi:hypothetical protein
MLRPDPKSPLYKDKSLNPHKIKPTKEPEATTMKSYELLKDTEFAAGFSAKWPAKSLKGEAKAIPDGIEEGKSWYLFEGVHRDYEDEFGEHMADLQEHRLTVNHEMEENSPSCLRLAQYNNYKLASDDPNRNKRLIRRLESNKQGTLQLYFNTANEIRNAAINYTPPWAHDCWPHYLIIQDPSAPLPLVGVDKVIVSFSFQVLQSNQLSTWPTGLPESHESDITIPSYIKLQHREHPDQHIYVGTMLFSNHPHQMNPVIAREQVGVVFYRRLPDDWKDFPAIGEKRRAQFDVKQLLREAITRFERIGADLCIDPDAYDIVSVNFGWEIIGHWESELVLSDISVRVEQA